MANASLLLLSCFLGINNDGWIQSGFVVVVVVVVVACFFVVLEHPSSKRRADRFDSNLSVTQRDRNL